MKKMENIAFVGTPFTLSSTTLVQTGGTSEDCFLHARWSRCVLLLRQPHLFGLILVAALALTVGSVAR